VFFDAFGITIDSINSISGDGLPPPLLLTGYMDSEKERKTEKDEKEFSIISHFTDAFGIKKLKKIGFIWNLSKKTLSLHLVS